MNPLGDSELPDLVSRALELRDQGVEPRLEELCAQRPDLIPEVREALKASTRIPMLQRSAAQRDPWLGRRLAARYLLTERLGAGAMGVVYRAEDQDLQRQVAVKILRSTLIDGEEAEFRFEREAESLAAVRHPAVVDIHDRGRTHDDDPFLVMELLEGATLAHILDEAVGRGATNQQQDTGWIAGAVGGSNLPESTILRMVVRWTADLASGLAAVHAKGIYHRDVKPSNIFIRSDGKALLMDFGIAARLDQATITREGAAIGTPAYMPPEALLPGHHPEPAVDIYSLTATLYHSLTLRAPYSGSPSQIIARLAQSDPPVASRVRVGLPRDLQAILDKGMARAPHKRYATIADLEADLRSFLDYRPVQARPIGRVGRLWRGFRRNAGAKAAAAVLLLVSLVGAANQGGQLWREHRRQSYLDALEGLPDSLTLVAPQRRAYASDERRKAVLASLDEIVRWRDAPMPALNLRASFRLDQGDVQGAREDMILLANEYPSTLAKVLAQRYRALPDDCDSALELDLTDLPEAESSDDAYLLAYHLMRAYRRPEAYDVALAPEHAEHMLCQELALTQFQGRSPFEVHEQAQWVEEQRGRGTAHSAYIQGIALILMKRYADAVEVQEAGLGFCPDSIGLHVNMGQALNRLEHYAEARRHYDRAIELEPNYLRPQVNLIRLLISNWSFDEAWAAWEASALGNDDPQRFVLAGEIETEAALAAAASGQDSEQRLHASEALAYFEKAGDSAQKVSRYHIAQALSNEDEEGVFLGLLKLLQVEPTTGERLRILLGWIPEDLSPQATTELSKYLHSLNKLVR